VALSFHPNWSFGGIRLHDEWLKLKFFEKSGMAPVERQAGIQVSRVTLYKRVKKSLKTNC